MINIFLAAQLATTIPDEKPGDKVILVVVLVFMLIGAVTLLPGIKDVPMGLKFCLVAAVLMILYVVATNLPA